MIRTLLSAVAIFALAPAAEAQVPWDTLARDATALRAELARIRADLEIVKTQLAQVLRLLSQRPAHQQGGAAAPSAQVRAGVAGAPFLGSSDAPVTVVEFSDYECAFCQRFFATTLPALKKEYIDAGKVRYVFRDYPLDQLHPRARKAAEAAHCAGEQGKFWEMHDLLFQNAKALSPPQLVEHARAIGLDGPAFDECLASGRHAARVEQSLADGAAAGVRGTPAFVIGRTKPGSDVVDGTAVRGDQPLETFRRLIDQALTQP